MTQFISKTREGAKVVSREADFLQYTPGTGSQPDIGGKRTIGGPNIDQTRRGVQYSNIQSAIDDLYSMSQQIPLNGILTTTESTPPIAIQQVETIAFSGTVTNIDPSLEKATIRVYGYPFVFDNTTNASSVCERVYNFFSDMVDNEKVFDMVSRKGTDGDMLEVRFIDAVPHQVTNIVEHGITQLGTIDVQAKPGYGDWTKLGEGDLPVDPPVHVYYFKRIA